MGNPKVLLYAEDLETINFDKIVRATLEIAVQGLDPETVETVLQVGGGLHTILPATGLNDICVLIDGEKEDREYWKFDGRSMTEIYAIRTGLGIASGASGVLCVESPTRGLAALCQSLAENHGKVPGVKGGSLYKKGMISVFAKELATLPGQASEIVRRLVRAIAASLKLENPAASFMVAAGKEWDGLNDALSAAGRADYEKARDMARDLQSGRSPHGRTFPLVNAKGQYAPQGIALETRNPNLMKHLWAAMKAMGPSFMVATAVVSHPDTKRIAVLSSTQYPVDIAPVAKALGKRFPKAEFDVNVERGSVIWDPRSQDARGPTPIDVMEIVSKHLGFKEDEREVRTPSLGATLGDALRLKARQKRR